MVDIFYIFKPFEKRGVIIAAEKLLYARNSSRPSTGGSLWASHWTEHFQCFISLNLMCELIVLITLGGRLYFAHVSSRRKRRLQVIRYL